MRVDPAQRHTPDIVPPIAVTIAGASKVVKR